MMILAILLIQERSGADLLPSSTVLYVEWRRPKEALDVILDHPLQAKLEALPGYQESLQTPEYQQFQKWLTEFEQAVGQKWRPGLETIVGGGVSFGVDALSGGAALMIRSTDEKALDALLTSRPELEADGEYRGCPVYRAGELRVGRSGTLLVVTNKPKLGESIVNALLDEDRGSLAKREAYQAAATSVDPAAAAWAYIDVGALRLVGAAKELLGGRAQDPGGEILLGGVLGSLHRTPYATAALTIERTGARLTLTCPHDPAWAGEPRRHFFGDAPPLPEVKNRLVALGAHRDLSDMWVHAGDLFDEATLDELAKGESGLTTLFAGKDFGEDVLGAFGPQIQFVAARQSFGLPEPAIKLPSFALVFRLKEPERVRAELRRTFISLVGFSNIVGAQNGQPPLDLFLDGEVLSSKFVPEEREKVSREARMQFNFSPSVAFAGDRFIVSSTEALARELTGARTAAVEPVNTHGSVDMAVLRQVLEDNRAHLIAQNMLEEGHSQKEAEAQIDVLLALAGFMRDTSLKLKTDASTMRLELDVRLKENP